MKANYECDVCVTCATLDDGSVDLSRDGIVYRYAKCVGLDVCACLGCGVWVYVFVYKGRGNELLKKSRHSEYGRKN
jgi:hypothetical protein